MKEKLSSESMNDLLKMYDEELLDSIGERVAMAPIRPQGFGFTTNEFIHKYHYGRVNAKKILNGMVKNGKLDSMEMRHATGGNVLVYFQPGTWKE